MQDRIPRDEAAARTYAPEAMTQPEWENPFTAPEKPKKPARDVPVYETVSGDMPFERRSAPAYIPQSYAPQQGYDPYGGYAAPYPPSGYDPYAAAPYPPRAMQRPPTARRTNDPYAAPAYDPRYSAPYPPERILRAAARLSALPAAGCAPAPEAPYAPPQPEMPRAPQPEYETAFYGSGIPAPESYPAPPYAAAPQRPPRR